MHQFSVACVQMNSGGDMAANMARIRAWCAEAAGRGAQLVALPENAFLMQAPDEPKFRAVPQEHPALPFCAELAQAHGVWLLAGSVAIWDEKAGKRRNRALLFNPEGAVAAHYDKIHLFDVAIENGESHRESADMVAGERAVTAPTPWGKIGLSVCYDLRFPQLYRALAKAGAAMLAVPSAFTYVTGQAHWHVLLRARAIETGCFVIAPAQCGEHPGGRRTYGHSLIVDPWGRVLAEAAEAREGVVVAKLDMEAAVRIRAQLPSLRHDRDFKLPEA